MRLCESDLHFYYIMRSADCIYHFQNISKTLVLMFCFLLHEKTLYDIITINIHLCTKGTIFTMHNRLRLLTEQLATDLKQGKYGPAGNPFLTVRALSAAHQISFDSACKIMNALQEKHLIRLCGKHYYITSGYVPPDSPYGVQLARTRQPLLALIVNRLESPFFSALAKRMSVTAERYGYTLLIVCSSNQARREAELLDNMLSLGVCGIFTNPSIAAEVREVYAHCPLPVVSIGRDLALPNCDTVLVDNASAGRQAADHLMEIGCEVFAYIGIPQYLKEDPRLRGYSEQLRQNGRVLSDDHILAAGDLPDSRIDIDSISGQLKTCLRNLPIGKKLGIFCYHDLLAAAVLQRIKHISHRSKCQFLIPQDVAIVGFDDLPIASAITPALTTVAYRYDAIVEQSFSIMADYLNHPDHLPGAYEINSALVIRESTVLT